jgi:chaperone BCS1
MMLNNSVTEAPTSLAQNLTLNATQNVMADANTTVKVPTDFSSLITFLYSFSALHDYVKLIVLGGAFETLRRFYSSSYKNLVDRFFVTATFESEDLSYGAHRFSRYPPRP